MKDAQFMTSKDKELVLKQWITFIKNDMMFVHFTDRIYKHLSLHCSFIAHFSKVGFYNTYFVNPEDTIKFIGQFDRDKGNMSIEYGGRLWIIDPDYNDLNQSMCKVVELYKEEVYRTRSNIIIQRDIENAKALMRKHGLTFITSR